MDAGVAYDQTCTHQYLIYHDQYNMYHGGHRFDKNAMQVLKKNYVEKQNMTLY